MPVNTHIINKNRLSLIDLHHIISEGQKIKLSKESIDAIEQCRSYLDEKITTTDAPIYGVNTGFGSLCDKKIDSSDLGKLQVNLVKSHACGTGDEVPREIVKLMLLLKIQSFSYGNSGVQISTVQRLVDMFNNDITSN